MESENQSIFSIHADPVHFRKISMFAGKAVCVLRQCPTGVCRILIIILFLVIPAIALFPEENEAEIADYFAEEPDDPVPAAHKEKTEPALPPSSGAALPEKKKPKLHNKSFFIATDYQNERLLDPMKNDIRGQVLGTRPNIFSFSAAYSWKQFWRIWPEASYHYFSRPAYDYHSLSANLVFTFFFRRRIPFTIHFLGGAGYGYINPSFKVNVQGNPVLHVGLRFRIRIYHGIFLQMQYLESVIPIGKFEYKSSSGDKKTFPTQSHDISGFGMGVGYAWH